MYGGRFVLAVVLPISLSLITGISGGVSPWVALFGITIAVINPTILEAMYERWKRQGALAHEAFDCAVLEIDWDPIHVGTRPSRERVTEWASRFRRKPTGQILANWYPPALASLPRTLGQLAGQRISSHWDQRLRKWYSTGMLRIVLAAAMIGLAVGIVRDSSLEGFVTASAALAPAIQWALREFRQQLSATKMCGRLAGAVVKRWRTCLETGICDLVPEVRAYQNALFDHRSRNPEVFAWVYRLSRDVTERDMKEVVERLVAEWHRASRQRDMAEDGPGQAIPPS